MGTAGWNHKQVKDLQATYGISNSLLAKILGIRPSTITYWGGKSGEEKVPKKYWPALSRYEDQCKQTLASISATQKVDSTTIGALAATALGIVVSLNPLTALLLSAAAPVFGSLIKVSDDPDSMDRECPFCAEIIKKKAVLCKHCKSEVKSIQ